MTSATHTHFNLKNVRVLSFSGQKVIPENEHYQLNLNIAHENRTKKFDLTAKYEHAEITGIDRISINERKTIIIKFNKLKRGWYRFNRITLMTTFPFGLFYSWTYVDCAVQFFVCPESIGELPLPEKRIEDDNVGIDKELGFSEFNEHKKHTNGMPYNRVDWKLYAKEKGMYVKNFEREQSSCSFFSLEYLSIQFPKLDLEQALGQLATWMKLSNESGGYWVLGLKEYQSYAGTGDLFLKECLIILAKYQRNEVELVI
jgi:uncharacterized protein (DUF58 family)